MKASKSPNSARLIRATTDAPETNPCGERFDRISAGPTGCLAAINLMEKVR